VAPDAYRDAGNAGGFGDEVRRHLRHGKPLAITEFGCCCCYAGAADRGGMDWAILDESADPARLDGDYTRDETEQVNYLTDLRATFAAAAWNWPSGSPSPGITCRTAAGHARIWI
jgi:hypothetical protein